MKLSNLIISFLLLVLASSCEVDGSFGNPCPQDEFVGIFEGAEDCDTDSEDVTVTITANGARAINFRIRYTDGYTLFSTEPVPLTDCSFSIGEGNELLEAMLDGNVLTIVSGGCIVTATKS